MRTTNFSATSTETKMLYDQITKIKAELHELVKNFGIVHELTVAKSQELDVIVNEYMIQKHQL